MVELWLNFKDENQEDQRVKVDKESFTIGRTGENDLRIANSGLSRNHAQIQRFADVFVISDCGSSNGTELNDTPLADPVALKNGDKVTLGNAVEVFVEVMSDEAEDMNAPSAGDSSGSAESGEVAPSATAAAATSPKTAAPAGFNPQLYLLLIPFFALLTVAFGGVVYLILRDRPGPVISSKKNDFPIDRETEDPDPTPTVAARNSPADVNGGSTQTSTDTNSNSTPEPSASITPKPSGASEKAEASSAKFLRAIAHNDPRAFLTGDQLAPLNAKINQLRGSSALPDNLRSARKNWNQLDAIAKTKNLKTMFLASAAIAKLGNQKGDVLATAQGMIETLDSLSLVLGNELADDSLLVIAAYDQGVAGQNLAMRDKVAGLTKKFPNYSSRKIRTIWFLKDKGEISESQFEFALRFLAIGTIAQNPKDFNVPVDSLAS